MGEHRLIGILKHEIRLVAIVGSYLLVCMMLVNYYAWSVSGREVALHNLLVAAASKAFVVAHFVTLGHRLGVGQTRQRLSLAARTLLRSAGLALLVILLVPLEEALIGLLEGQPLGFKLQEMFAAGANFVVSRTLMIFLLLIPVAFLVELVRDSSADEVRRLLLGRTDGRRLISFGSREEVA